MEEECTVLGKTFIQDRLEILMAEETPEIRKDIKEAQSVR